MLLCLTFFNNRYIFAISILNNEKKMFILTYFKQPQFLTLLLNDNTTEVDIIIKHIQLAQVVYTLYAAGAGGGLSDCIIIV